MWFLVCLFKLVLSQLGPAVGVKVADIKCLKSGSIPCCQFSSPSSEELPPLPRLWSSALMLLCYLYVVARMDMLSQPVQSLYTTALSLEQWLKEMSMEYIKVPPWFVTGHHKKRWEALLTLISKGFRASFPVCLATGFSELAYELSFFIGVGVEFFHVSCWDLSHLSQVSCA